jgi:hypothetical protein
VQEGERVKAGEALMERPDRPARHPARARREGAAALPGRRDPGGACSPRPAISGKIDYLRGLKENVIMGRLIPAGTGMEFYRKIKIPGEVIEHRPRSGMDGGYEAEYVVEPEHIRPEFEV